MAIGWHVPIASSRCSLQAATAARILCLALIGPSCIHGKITYSKYRLSCPQEPSPEKGLATLINTVMSPWASIGDFAQKVGEGLRRAIEANIAQPTKHGFVMMGKERLFLDHLPMFHEEAHRFHAILEVELDDAAMAKYREVQVGDTTKKRR
jgi:hypothetical protein